ncbi:putative beta-D-xylosidase 2 [Drosera capensis]
MAKPALRFLFFFTCIAISILVSEAAFHVCDKSRYAKLGMTMSDYAFCDRRLPYHVRVKDLVDRMTLYEKTQNLGSRAKGVDRLGVPAYQWWSEALHGISDQGTGGVHFDKEVPGATSFPLVILTAATFNESLWKAIGEVVSTEGRAMYNLQHAGLTFWSPVINVVRDPRWGRTLETPGEDPYTVGRYAINFVRGMQDVEGNEHSDDPNSRPLKVAACCKHMAAYDLENSNGTTRFVFDAKVTQHDMVETFLRPFEMCVKEGDVSSVMCSYNQIDGIPSCADAIMLNETVRNAWNLHGYIVADCDAVEEMNIHQHFLNYTPEETVARFHNIELGYATGLDLDCEDWRTFHSYYGDHLENATLQGKVREEDIDRSLKYLFTVQMRLGYFDGDTPFENLGKKDICTDQHVELSAETAREGIVLLKNNDHTLPLKPDDFKTLAIIGPHGNASDVMLGNYAAYTSITFAQGCPDVACQNQNLFGPALQAAKNADATVIITGLDRTVELEDNDRTNLLLPGNQTQLINQVAKDSKGPVILVIMSAGGVDISFAEGNDDIKSILWAGYPGEQGGHAIADVVFGAYNPGGRLPVTWYPNDYIYQIPMASMLLRPNNELGYPGRTYRFYTGPTVYPFGYGLSYTTFLHHIDLPKKQSAVHVKLGKHVHCRDLPYEDGITKPGCPAVMVSDLKCEEHFNFHVVVENTGDRDGSQVVIVYSKPPEGVSGAHEKQVIGFQRVFVPAGGQNKVKFSFNACKALGIVDFKSSMLLPSGAHTIIVGDARDSFPVQVTFRY